MIIPYYFLFFQVIDDPAGNSFIENPLAPKADPLLSVKLYTRTSEQDKELGIMVNSNGKMIIKKHKKM